MHKQCCGSYFDFLYQKPYLGLPFKKLVSSHDLFLLICSRKHNASNILLFQVKTKDVKTAQCKSVADPHITTFDGLYYHHYFVGDYVLVNSTARIFSVINLFIYQCYFYYIHAWIATVQFLEQKKRCTYTYKSDNKNI